LIAGFSHNIYQITKIKYIFVIFIAPNLRTRLKYLPSRTINLNQTSIIFQHTLPLKVVRFRLCQTQFRSLFYLLCVIVLNIYS